MLCPCCNHNGMLFETHNGMDQNVCEQCGTVIECESFVADVFQPGLREVPFPYQSRPSSSKNVVLLNPKSKILAESYDLLCQLTDRLNLPTATKELAGYFLQYSRKFDKRCSVGACLYLAMKRHDIPITLKYISNYLQLSHFSVGRVMKLLQKRIGPAASDRCAFAADRLALLIFSQAKFGGCDGGKRRLTAFLYKTEQLLRIVEKWPSAISYQPHVILLAAGYVVWRSALVRGWIVDEEDLEYPWPLVAAGEGLEVYLSVVGIQLSDRAAIYAKVRLVCSALRNVGERIPWIAERIRSKEALYSHLDDLLKYGIQAIAEDTVKVEEKESVDKCDGETIDIKSNLRFVRQAEELPVGPCAGRALVFRKVEYRRLMGGKQSAKRLKEESSDEVGDECGTNVAKLAPKSINKCYPSCLAFP